MHKRGQIAKPVYSDEPRETMKMTKTQQKASIWFDDLLTKHALGDTTPREILILDRLQKIRHPPRPQCVIVHEAKTSYETKLLLKMVKSQLRKAEKLVQIQVNPRGCQSYRPTQALKTPQRQSWTQEIGF